MIPVHRFREILNQRRLAHMFADMESTQHQVKRIVCHPEDFRNFIFRLPEHLLEDISRLAYKGGIAGKIWDAEIFVDENQPQSTFTFVPLE